jgi:hypothetical protein
MRQFPSQTKALFGRDIYHSGKQPAVGVKILAGPGQSGVATASQEITTNLE